jgi:hypothetical protein
MSLCQESVSNTLRNKYPCVRRVCLIHFATNVLMSMCLIRRSVRTISSFLKKLKEAWHTGTGSCTPLAICCSVYGSIRLRQEFVLTLGYYGRLPTPYSAATLASSLSDSPLWPRILQDALRMSELGAESPVLRIFGCVTLDIVQDKCGIHAEEGTLPRLATNIQKPMVYGTEFDQKKVLNLYTR